MTKNALPYLMLIKDSLDHIVSYQPSSKDTFLRDQMLQDAILMRLQEAGENLIRIRDKTPEYFDKHGGDTWIKVIGLRNLISHGYHLIEPERIWDALLHDIPPFAEQINTLVRASDTMKYA